jgi:hypothetical protein
VNIVQLGGGTPPVAQIPGAERSLEALNLWGFISAGLFVIY